jgi:hypothetical protein
MNKRPKAFLSYSHDDRDIAEQIAKSLRHSGIDVWFDKWEILPGDSLIQKIFEEGLSDTNAFIVLLTNNSIRSRWVQQELDAALVRRIEGVTRIIPVVDGNVQIPEALRPTRWIRLSDDFDSNIRELQSAIFQVYERPPLGQPPGFVRNQINSIGGLSRLATTVGLFFVSTGKHELGNEESFSASELASKLEFSPEQTDDAIDELESLGMVKTLNYFGTAPYSHGDVTPTYALFIHFKDYELNYDPDNDIKIIASAIVAEKEVDGPRLVELTGITPLRINRAINYLSDYGIAKTLRTLGTAPFDFREVYATGSTRRFIA